MLPPVIEKFLVKLENYFQSPVSISTNQMVNNTESPKTRIYQPRGITYNSSSHGTIPIATMNYMHLVNAVRSIENEARVVKRELAVTNSNYLQQIDNYTLPALAAELCPVYQDMLVELEARNRTRNYTNTSEETPMQNTTEEVNNMNITQARSNDMVQQITARLTSLKQEVNTSVNVLRGVVPVAILSDLDDLTKLVDEMGQLFDQLPTVIQSSVQQVEQTPEPSVQVATTEVQAAAPVEDAPVVPEIPAIDQEIKDFQFGEIPRTNSLTRNRIKKYMPSVRTVRDLANYSKFDLLTIMTAEHAYNVCNVLDEAGVTQYTKNPIYLEETDFYPDSISGFIKKCRTSREAFERRTNVSTLDSIPYDDKERWIVEADRIHENISERARVRYKVLSNYVSAFFDPQQMSMNFQTWLDTILKECSVLTRDEVKKWFYRTNR